MRLNTAALAEVEKLLEDAKPDEACTEACRALGFNEEDLNEHAHTKAEIVECSCHCHLYVYLLSNAAEFMKALVAEVRASWTERDLFRAHQARLFHVVQALYNHDPGTCGHKDAMGCGQWSVDTMKDVLEDASLGESLRAMRHLQSIGEVAVEVVEAFSGELRHPASRKTRAVRALAEVMGMQVSGIITEN